MRRIALALMILMGAATAGAQVDNTVYAKQFQGTNVGFKVAAAQAACNPNAALQCFIVLDPSLKNYATGTIPTLASNQHLIDYRNGLPWGSGEGFVTVSADGTVFCLPYFTGSTSLGDSPICFDSATGTTVATINASGEIILNAPLAAVVGTLQLNPFTDGSYPINFLSETANEGMHITETSGGSGYTLGQVGICTVNGGTYTLQATCSAYVAGTGELGVVIVNPGLYTVAATSVSVTGLTSGSGFAYTLALGTNQIEGWTEQNVYASNNTGQRGFQHVFAAPGAQADAGGSFFVVGTFLQSPLLGSAYSWKVPQPNLIGLTQGNFDMDSVTANRNWHYPDASGTFMVQLTTTGCGGGATFSGGVLCVPSSSTGISNIQITLPTSPIGENACTSYSTTTMTGVTITTTFSFSPASDPSGASGWGANGGLMIASYPTANTLNWAVCNQTSGTITPGSLTANVSAR
jgi:hypothetical protein